MLTAPPASAGGAPSCQLAVGAPWGLYIFCEFGPGRMAGMVTCKSDVYLSPNFLNDEGAGSSVLGDRRR